jgi:hypothetical protein
VKTLKQIFEDIADQPRSSSDFVAQQMAAAEKQKPGSSANLYKAEPATRPSVGGGNKKVAALMKSIATIISPESLSTMSQEDVNLLAQRVQQHIDVTEFQAEKIKNQVTKEPGTNAGTGSSAKPLPTPANQDQTPGKRNNVA